MEYPKNFGVFCGFHVSSVSTFEVLELRSFFKYMNELNWIGKKVIPQMLKIILANALSLCQLQNGGNAPLHIINKNTVKYILFARFFLLLLWKSR